MSNRERRLNTRAAELRTLEYVAQIRVSNAERGMARLGNGNYPANVPAAFRMEIDAARQALRDIHTEQQEIITELDRHTTDFPNAAMIMVETSDGYQIFERRDPDGTGSDETHWYHLNDPDDASSMTFVEVTGDVVADQHGNDMYRAYDFHRLYTQDEVDDLLDEATGL
jgi:hypothetical protein